MNAISKQLSDESDEISDLSSVAQEYVNGRAWSMAAGIFHAIERRARAATQTAILQSHRNEFENPMRKKKYRARKNFKKYGKRKMATHRKRGRRGKQ